MSAVLDLWDYRRRVQVIYREVREGGAGVEAWERWVAARDDLFATHPQSPIEDRSSFDGLPYHPFDAGWRTTGRFTPDLGGDAVSAIPASGGDRFTRIGTVHFELAGQECSLEVLWLEAYGGGLFLPFRDGTNGDTTYGGGRYLLDTVKGADLGHQEDDIVLDFNYAYHPSCVHSERWTCPLAPPANRLPFPMSAGERLIPKVA